MAQHRHFAVIVLCAVLAPGCDKGRGTSVPDGPPVSVLPATYGEGSDAPQEVRKKCKFEQEVAEAVIDNYPSAKLTTGETSGRVLNMEVVTMRGADPASQGERKVILQGEVLEDGTQLGTFKITRASEPGGVFGGMTDVCRGLDDIAEQMGPDIAAFIADPAMNAEL